MSYLRSLAVVLFVLTISGMAVCQDSRSYEVAVIRASKPGRGYDWDQSDNRLSIRNYTLRNLLREAYGLKSNSQVIGGPKWLDDRHFDIEAKIDDIELARIRGLSDAHARAEEDRLMLQALLTERFKIALTRELRALPVYALVVAKSGIKITSTAPPLKAGQPAPAPHSSISGSLGHAKVSTNSMEAFADWLTQKPETGNQIVLNKTGLTGDYSFQFDWTPDRGQGVSEDATFPGLFTALKEELGLELKAEKNPIKVIIVQAASEPTLD